MELWYELLLTVCIIVPCKDIEKLTNKLANMQINKLSNIQTRWRPYEIIMKHMKNKNKEEIHMLQ